MSAPDQLRELFRMQQALNERIGVHTASLSDEEEVRWILNYSRAMSQELSELTDSVPWKWWAKYQQFDQQNARVEVVDLFQAHERVGETGGWRAYLREAQQGDEGSGNGHALHGH